MSAKAVCRVWAARGFTPAVRLVMLWWADKGDGWEDWFDSHVAECCEVEEAFVAELKQRPNVRAILDGEDVW